jgi:hypothetical protein
MSSKEILVSDGPDKADLLRAVANPYEHLHVTFRTPTEMVEAHVDMIEEISQDGMTFGLRGHLTYGSLNGARFAAIYEVGSRSGKLVLRRGQPDLEP